MTQRLGLPGKASSRVDWREAWTSSAPAIMDLVGRHQADAEMAVMLVVPVQEGAAEGAGVLDGAEPPGELGLVFQGLEAAFREAVVVGGVGPAVRFGDAQVGEQQGGGLGLHGRAAVGVQGGTGSPGSARHR